MTSLSDNTVVTTSGGLAELGYSQITSAVSITNGTYGTGTEVIAPVTVVCDGSPIVVEFFSQNVYMYTPPAIGDVVDVALWYDGAEYARYWGRRQADTVQPTGGAMYLQYRITPTAGVHTFGVKAVATAAPTRPGGVNAGTSGANVAPAFLRISKVLQASQLIVPLASAPLVTSLPSAPIDGQEIRYVADATNGIIWNLRYRAASSSSYKWEFIGGSSMSQLVVGGQTWGTNESTTSLNHTTLATAGPQVTVPLAGDYDCKAQAMFWNAAQDSLGSILISYPSRGTVSWNYGDAVSYAYTSYQAVTLSARIKATVAANDVIQLKYATSNVSYAAYFNNRNLWVTPIRVG